MNLDKFSKRRRPDDAADTGSKEYDFSAIAEAAVNDMRAQQNDDDLWANGNSDAFAPRTFDEAPKARRKGLSFGKKAESSDPWDQPVDAGEVLNSGPAAPRRERSNFGKRRADAHADRFDAPGEHDSFSESEPRSRKPFGFGRSKGDIPAEQFDRPRSRDSISDDGEPRSRKPFGFGKNRGDTQPDQFDLPRDRDSISDNGEPRRRKSFSFGKGKGEIQPDQFDRSRDRDALDDQLSPEASTPEGRTGFRRRDAGRPSAISEPVEAGIIDDFDDGFSDFDEPAAPIAAPQPAAPSAVPTASEPERRVFNAATQPNYSYMTDYAEVSEPAPPASPTPENNTGGLLSSVRSALLSKLGKDEPGVQYYTPPANRAPSDVRRRQKRRNHKPLAPWVKASLFGAGLAAVFLLILYIAFYTIVTGRLNYVGESHQNPVYLSVEEYANLKADLTDTEENAAEFTEPISFVEQDKDIKVIMLVSSDSRIGDVYDDNGKKITNESAKTDSIMLVAVDHENRRLRVASIMTDAYVRIQDYKTNKLSKAYYYDTANGDYTLPCLRQAIHDNFGITPDNYVVVDFSAFQILVNRLGGINIEVSADEAYYMSAHKRYGDFPRFNSAGEYNMSGAEALNYARMRAVGNDDYDRSARQRVVLSKVLAEISKMSTLELAELAYALLPELPTDMTAGELFDYLTDAADIASYEINEVTFPITNSWRYGTASVRSEDESLYNPYDTVSSPSDVSGSDVSVAPATNNKFTVIVANYQFNSTVLQKFLYENDDSYLNGTAASGIVVPDIIAPLDSGSPAAALTAPAE